MRSMLASVLLYFSAILQTSFLPHFTIWNFTPSLILAIVLVWNLLENRDKNFGFFIAIAGGFFLDIFSQGFFGFQILICLLLCISAKWVIKKYVRIQEI